MPGVWPWVVLLTRRETNMQAYSNPSKEHDEHSLLDLEIFYSDSDPPIYDDEEWEQVLSPGFYWWVCLPGCLPDSEPTGPFETEAEALADARSVAGCYLGDRDKLVDAPEDAHKFRYKK